MQAFQILAMISLLAATSLAAAPVTLPGPAPLAVVLVGHLGERPEDDAIRQSQERIRRAGAGADALESLGWAFIAKARCTQDAGFFKLAELTATALAECTGGADAARLLRGHALHHQHRFAEAEAIAHELVTTRGGAHDWALWSDTLLELGRLEEATRACQEFCNRQPGLEAYSRAAHLRWLHGDLAGATAAMEAAASAGSPRAPEPLAWVLTRLARYRLQSGDPASARRCAETALKLLPDFAPAWLAIGQAACALEATPEAVQALRRAVGLNPSPEAQWWLADVLRQSGDEPGAVEVERNLRAHGPLADPRTTALYLATRGIDTATAVALAQEELHARGDVHTQDAIAWTLAANEENAAAATAMRTALQVGTCDPRLHLHAAIIAQAGGRAKEAQAQAARATAWQFALTPSERGRLLRFRSAPDVSLHSVIKNP